MNVTRPFRVANKTVSFAEILQSIHKAHENGSHVDPVSAFGNWFARNITRITHTKNPAHPPSNQLKIYRQKGHETYKKITTALTSTGVKDAPLPDLAGWDIDVSPVQFFDSNTRLCLQAINWDHDDMPRYFRTYEHHLHADRYFQYMNHMGPKVGIMIAEYNQGIDASGQRAPDRWSEVVWKSWTDETYADRILASNLRYVVQESIINLDTQAILDEVTRDQKNSENGDNPDDVFVYEFTPDDEDFYAILSSPNCIGTARIAMNYPNGLGSKTVSMIRVFNIPETDYWDMVIELQPYSE